LVPWFVETGIINYTIDNGTYGHIGAETGFPGMPRVATTTTNSEDFAMELLAYVQLSAGLHTMGVNSDDGFRLTLAKCVSDPSPYVLGQYPSTVTGDAGRGAADTTFTFQVAQTGLYPMRLVYEQGVGGANIEWWEFNCPTRPDSNDHPCGS